MSSTGAAIPWSDLEDYVALYLKEEIQQEALVRNLDGFSRFLNSVATTNAQQLNFAELANDAQLAPKTVREYYQVLEDTLIGHILPPYEKTVKRKAISTAKFYLFDTGVTNFLLGRKSISAKTPEFGTIFEQMIFCELKAYLDYQKMIDCLFYWRSKSQFEVDFLIKDNSNEWTAIEVKASANPAPRDYKGIKALEEDLKLKKKFVVCMSENSRIVGSVEILFYLDFLKSLWADQIIEIKKTQPMKDWV